MTMPNERARALRVAGEVLTELLHAPNLTENQKHQVRWALRHYPSPFEIDRLARDVQANATLGMPMLVPEKDLGL